MPEDKPPRQTPVGKYRAAGSADRPEAQPAVDYRVRLRQLRLAYDNTPAALLINSVTAVLASLIIYSPLPTPLLAGWTGGIIAILFARWRLWVRYSRQGSAADQDAPRWQRYLLTVVTINGLWWGFYGVLAILYSGPQGLGFIGFILGGMVAGAVATLGALLPAYICFALPVAICVVLILFWLGDMAALTMAGLALSFFAAMFTTVRRVNRIITSNFELTLKNDLLVQSLVRANSELSATNANLEHEIEERARAEQQIQFLATHDALTGLANRRLQEDRFLQAAARSMRKQLCLALLFIDLDDFKEVNDSYGHPVGDRVLRRVADRLKECLRSDESVCRQGGDEFLLLAEITSRTDAETIAQRILAALGDKILLEDREIQVGASIGISLYPDHGTDFNQLVSKADQALYAAKRQSKGQFCFYG